MQKLLSSILATATVLACAGTAFASRGGKEGFTGKPTADFPNGASCNLCHRGGTAPTVSFTGPMSLDANQTADYTFVVTTGQASTGAGVAATDNVTLTPQAGFRESYGELVQGAPVPPNGGAATYRFRVTAGPYGGTVKLWGVGLASNGSGTNGDLATQTTYDITVSGPPAPPDAGAPLDGGADAAGSISSSSGTTGQTGAPGDDDDDPSATPDDRTGSPRGTRRSTAETSSCAIDPSSPSPSSTLGFALAAVIAIARRRKR
jgi:MYXO-CTERM domain-containing protein